MKLNNTLFSERPETLQAVNVNLTGGEALGVVHPQMPVTAKHQGVVSLKFIGIDNGTAPDGLNGQTKDAFGGNVFNNFHFGNSVSFQDTEDRDLAGRSPAPGSFSSASEIGFIHLNLSLEKVFIRTVGRDTLPDNIKRLQDRRVGKTQLLGCLPGRDFQFKELNQPEPFSGGNKYFTEPASGEERKFITALLTPVFPASYPVYFSGLAAVTEITAVFLTRFCQKPISLNFVM